MNVDATQLAMLFGGPFGMVPVAPKREKNTDENRLKCHIFLAFLDDSC